MKEKNHKPIRQGFKRAAPKGLGIIPPFAKTPPAVGPPFTPMAPFSLFPKCNGP